MRLRAMKLPIQIGADDAASTPYLLVLDDVGDVSFDEVSRMGKALFAIRDQTDLCKGGLIFRQPVDLGTST